MKRTAIFALALVLLTALPVQVLRAEGVLMLVGDVLPLKNQVVWRNLVKIAERKQGENLIIAAAHSRTKAYGGFAQRSFERYGTSAELLPIAEVFQEFSTDYEFAAEDAALADRVLSSSSVFFVGGQPQRLSRIMFKENGDPRALARAVKEAYAAGSMIIGGIPGATILSTEADPIETLTDGKVKRGLLPNGLNLVEDWFVDQHYFGNGRFASGLIAMHQLGMNYGVGIGLDTAAVFHNNVIEVLGNRGVAVVDISDAEIKRSRKGVRIQGVRLSYLENGDRFEIGQMNLVPYQTKENGFQLEPVIDASANPIDDSFVSSKEMFTPGELLRLMVEALEAKSGQSRGYALHHDSRDGFSFRFYTGPDSTGWLATDDSGERYTIANIYLDIEPLD